LKSVDLPTLGRPTKATRGRARGMAAFLKVRVRAGLQAHPETSER